MAFNFLLAMDEVRRKAANLHPRITAMQSGDLSLEWIAENDIRLAEIELTLETMKGYADNNGSAVATLINSLFDGPTPTQVRDDAQALLDAAVAYGNAVNALRTGVIDSLALTTGAQEEIAGRQRWRFGRRPYIPAATSGLSTFQQASQVSNLVTALQDVAGW